MKAYVIYGYEFSTNERGAAPEACEYQVVEVEYGENDNLNMAIHSDFSAWKTNARARVWKKAYQSIDFNNCSPDTIASLLTDFDKSTTIHWYFLTQEEYNEWVEWAANDKGMNEVTIAKYTIETK